MNDQRLQRLTEQIVAHGLDGLALVPGPNLLYFCLLYTSRCV